MAFDIQGILISVLLFIQPIASTNIDCSGKPFHCVNSTHFMICVDLGSGVSITIDDFVIPCPPVTVCQRTNIFECEFPAITTTVYPLEVMGVNEQSENPGSSPEFEATEKLITIKQNVLPSQIDLVSMPGVAPEIVTSVTTLESVNSENKKEGTTMPHNTAESPHGMKVIYEHSALPLQPDLISVTDTTQEIATSLTKLGIENNKQTITPLQTTIETLRDVTAINEHSVIPSQIDAFSMTGVTPETTITTLESINTKNKKETTTMLHITTEIPHNVKDTNIQRETTESIPVFKGTRKSERSIDTTKPLRQDMTLLDIITATSFASVEIAMPEQTTTTKFLNNSFHDVISNIQFTISNVQDYNESGTLLSPTEATLRNDTISLEPLQKYFMGYRNETNLGILQTKKPEQNVSSLNTRNRETAIILDTLADSNALESKTLPYGIGTEVENSLNKSETHMFQIDISPVNETKMEVILINNDKHQNVSRHLAKIFTTPQDSHPATVKVKYPDTELTSKNTSKLTIVTSNTTESSYNVETYNTLPLKQNIQIPKQQDVINTNILSDLAMATETEYILKMNTTDDSLAKSSSITNKQHLSNHNIFNSSIIPIEQTEYISTVKGLNASITKIKDISNRTLTLENVGNLVSIDLLQTSPDSNATHESFVESTDASTLENIVKQDNNPELYLTNMESMRDTLINNVVPSLDKNKTIINKSYKNSTNTALNQSKTETNNTSLNLNFTDINVTNEVVSTKNATNASSNLLKSSESSTHATTLFEFTLNLSINDSYSPINYTKEFLAVTKLNDDNNTNDETFILGVSNNTTNDSMNHRVISKEGYAINTENIPTQRIQSHQQIVKKPNSESSLNNDSQSITSLKQNILPSSTETTSIIQIEILNPMRNDTKLNEKNTFVAQNHSRTELLNTKSRNMLITNQTNIEFKSTEQTPHDIITESSRNAENELRLIEPSNIINSKNTLASKNTSKNYPVLYSNKDASELKQASKDDATVTSEVTVAEINFKHLDNRSSNDLPTTISGPFETLIEFNTPSVNLDHKIVDEKQNLDKNQNAKLKINTLIFNGKDTIPSSAISNKTNTITNTTFPSFSMAENNTTGIQLEKPLILDTNDSEVNAHITKHYGNLQNTNDNFKLQNEIYLGRKEAVDDSSISTTTERIVSATSTNIPNRTVFNKPPAMKILYATFPLVPPQVVQEDVDNISKTEVPNITYADYVITEPNVGSKNYTHTMRIEITMGDTENVFNESTVTENKDNSSYELFSLVNTYTTAKSTQINFDQTTKSMIGNEKTPENFTKNVKKNLFLSDLHMNTPVITDTADTKFKLKHNSKPTIKNYTTDISLNTETTEPNLNANILWTKDLETEILRKSNFSDENPHKMINTAPTSLAVYGAPATVVMRISNETINSENSNHVTVLPLNISVPHVSKNEINSTNVVEESPIDIKTLKVAEKFETTKEKLVKIATQRNEVRNITHFNTTSPRLIDHNDKDLPNILENATMEKNIVVGLENHTLTLRTNETLTTTVENIKNIPESPETHAINTSSIGEELFSKNTSHIETKDGSHITRNMSILAENVFEYNEKGTSNSTKIAIKKYSIATNSEDRNIPKEKTPTTTNKPIGNIDHEPENADKFSCRNLSRGKYADNSDCRKFYTCVGSLEPTVGACPNNTVFSDLNKQCTRNLSHCVRNNQFLCLREGRYRDFFRDNTYYICVKNSMNKFMRYKLQCQNGYRLNKATVKCELYMETSSQSSVGEYFQRSNDSSGSASKSKENITFECLKEGRFSDPEDCRKYYICFKNNKSEYRRKIKFCGSDEVFHRKKEKCVDNESYECWSG